MTPLFIYTLRDTFVKTRHLRSFSVTKMAIVNYRKRLYLIADDVRNKLGWDISTNLMFLFIETAFGSLPTAKPSV